MEPSRKVLARNLAFLAENYPSTKPSQKLADRANIGRESVRRARIGESDATLGVVDGLAKAYDLTPSELLCPALPATLAGQPKSPMERLEQALQELPFPPDQREAIVKQAQDNLKMVREAMERPRLRPADYPLESDARRLGTPQQERRTEHAVSPNPAARRRHTD
ncbi:MAG: hypothetical protein ACRCV9_14480 [Burkholderiaceae bacterium]